MPEVLCHLPLKAKEKLSRRSVVISADWCDAFHIPQSLSRDREIVIVSDKFMREHPQPDNHFISALLHELAHAYLGHGNKADDRLTQEQKNQQEQEADTLASAWFPQFVTNSDKTESTDRPYSQEAAPCMHILENGHPDRPVHE